MQCLVFKQRAVDSTGKGVLGIERAEIMRAAAKQREGHMLLLHLHDHRSIFASCMLCRLSVLSCTAAGSPCHGTAQRYLYLHIVSAFHESASMPDATCSGFRKSPSFLEQSA